MDLRPLKNSTLIVVALVYGFALWFAGFAGWFGIPLRLLVGVSLLRYAYDVLRRFAQGRYESVPAPSIESMSPLADRGFVLHGLFFVLLVYLFVSTPLLGDSAGATLVRLAALGLAAVVFPASAALMSLGNTPGGALNPADIVACIRTFGRDYAVLLGLGLAVVLVSGLAQGVLAALAGGFAGLVYSVAMVWTFLALFALIGAALHEHRLDFAIPGEHEPEEELVERQRREQWQQAADRAYTAFRSGLPAKGHATIRQLLDEEGRSLAIYQWVFDQLIGWADKGPALHLAVTYVERLLDSGLEHEALDLFATCRRLSPEFAIAAPRADALVSYARSIGRHGIADELMASESRLPGGGAETRGVTAPDKGSRA